MYFMINLHGSGCPIDYLNFKKCFLGKSESKQKAGKTFEGGRKVAQQLKTYEKMYSGNKTNDQLFLWCGGDGGSDKQQAKENRGKAPDAGGPSDDTRRGKSLRVGVADEWISL